MRVYLIILPLLILQVAAAQEPMQKAGTKKERAQLAKEMAFSLENDLLQKWYPQAIDTVYGGFLGSFTYDFKPTEDQDKMIVTQARHTWTNAQASMRYPLVAYYKAGARNGFYYLRNVFWDETYGGFYTLLSRDGKPKGDHLKTAYGNAFAIYALASYYAASKDEEALVLAKQAFLWLEANSHDPLYKGYFQNLQRNGTPIKRPAATPSTSDLGYKGQNSSIHLLEAFTQLYLVWPDPLVAERLREMLLLIRDTLVTQPGFLTLFFQPDWTPLSFKDSTEAVILQHRYLDHVSFGHDVETAYLLLEASHVLGLKDDTTTMGVAKRLVDHALKWGWDKKLGGFYDEGYYFKNHSTLTIIKNTKNWWAQAESLNTLLLMADYFPKDKQRYFQKFKQLWTYIQTYLIDHQYGDWFEEGLDGAPARKTALKGHTWKATYHQYRSLSNCIDRLAAKPL